MVSPWPIAVVHEYEILPAEASDINNVSNDIYVVICRYLVGKLWYVAARV